MAIPAAAPTPVASHPLPADVSVLLGPVAAGGRRDRVLASLTAALVAVVAQVTGMWLASVHPFGKRPWAVNDAYNQLLPQKAYVRELLLHPGGPNSLLFNWHSGLGVPYLGDFATYAASPFNLLLVFVPRDRLTLGVQVITLVQIATAAAVMALVLLSLHRAAPWGVAAALGAAYAGCGWVTGDAIVVLSWMDGLVAFPVLLWAAVQLIRRRRLIPAVLLVALFWMANYYTAVMATLGVGLVVVALLVVDRPTVRDAAVALGRVIGGFALGIAMISWLVLPVLDAVRSAAPGPETSLYQVSWATTLARLFPGNWSLGSAGLFVGLGALILVAAAPWNRRLPVRARLTLVILPVASVVSMQIPATQLAWHSFAVPNGSAYREAFVIAGILAITAWVGLATGLPGRWPLLGGVLTVAALGAVLSGELSIVTLLFSGADLVLIALVCAVPGSHAETSPAAARPSPSPRLLALVMVGTVLIESTYTAGATYRDKARFHGAPTTLSASVYAARLAEVPPVPDGERTRAPRSTDNDPLLLGYNGIDYYSSTVPRVTTDALSGLGLPYGRRRISLAGDDPAVPALLGIHGRADDRVAALATVLPSGPVASDPAAAGTVWATRDLLAGIRLYTVPSLRFTDPSNGRVAIDQGITAAGPATVELSGRCPAGSTLQMVTHPDDRRAHGSISWQDRTVGWGDPVVHTLGSVPADGAVTLTIRGTGLDVRPGDVGCLDPAALDRMVTTSRSQGADVRFGKERVSVSWPAPQTGDAVILTTALPGWACRTDAGPVPVAERAGMLTVPVRGPPS
ncbi:YfhO family protein [Raineyella fluvialis]|uniref:YfhO family protein n=1 Tax=Raineyella fluvialis TaxID=2662261 RepID=A0A5Q2FGZ6_9ACTN|nr:YfhO family protein [Raineyella fluvialis]QGF23586.1 YfhO family protein [Raineyella fluvialis]